MLLTNAGALSWAAPISLDRCDVRLEGERIVEIAPSLSRNDGEAVFDLDGARLAPGLHDHHIHLRALAAVDASVILGPPEIQTPEEFTRRLRVASAQLVEGQWLRAVAYHESVAGDLDRYALDAIVPERPVRIQHASGVLWMVNSAGLEALQIGSDAPPGAERDTTGALTGRFWREDEWLGARLPRTSHDFSELSQLAASRGVTGFTDATPWARDGDIAGYVEAIENKTLMQRLMLMAEPGTSEPLSPLVTLGPTKILLDDMTLPSFDELADRITDIHDAGRSAALHCVTRTQGILALSVLEAVGVIHGDRIEHGSILGAESLAVMARLGVTLITQPGFLVTRGDRFDRQVPEGSKPDLWRVGSALKAGVTLGASSDAPYGDPDPWLGIMAAVHRQSLGGRVVGVSEAVDGATAVSLYTGMAENPGRQRRVAVGELADLVVVEPGTAGYGTGPGPKVRATFVAGRLVYSAP